MKRAYLPQLGRTLSPAVWHRYTRFCLTTPDAP